MGAEAFGSRLKQLRQDAGLTQKELAERAGLTLEGVAQLERGRRKPSWETVLALAKALGVPCTAFEADEGAEAPPAPPRQPGRPRKRTEKGKRKK
jgi:transcriptional regulator with XRE-family HTH domain